MHAVWLSFYKEEVSFLKKIEAADVDLEVDVECSDEKRDTDRRNSLSENVKDIEVEEFYVKYKN